MKVDVLLGLQWGDEGKGKIVDVLSPQYDIIARFQGGPNAGHSLEINKIKHVLHTLPSGVFREDKMNVIGNGVVIDPVVLKEEIESVKKLGVNLTGRLIISNKASLILPGHKHLDAAYESFKGKNKIGSTLKGIGPAYTDRVARSALRMGDSLLTDFETGYEAIAQRHEKLLAAYGGTSVTPGETEEWMQAVAYLKDFDILNTEYYLNNALKSGKTVLAEGAQGTMLDVDFGSYPFVTSSNTISAGVCAGLGISPQSIGEVFGIFKAYCTRVGSGPFPTELHDKNGEMLQKAGNEFGATTGRPRRCGWLDLNILNYAIMLNGVTQLIMTKADVMHVFDKLQLADSYVEKGRDIHELPYEFNKTPELNLRSFPAWKKDISDVLNYEQLPKELTDYIQYIEKRTAVPVKYISVGPNRKQIIAR